METIKYRIDFSAHQSLVVEVPDTENAEEDAIELAMRYVNDFLPIWEVDDGGIEEVDDNEKPINNIKINFD